MTDDRDASRDPAQTHGGVHMPCLGKSARLRVPAFVQAISTVSRAGIIHRDIAPKNFVTGLEGGIHDTKVIDFGLAIKASDVRDGQPWCGTLSHTAPEALDGKVTA